MELEGLTAYLLFMAIAVNRGVEYAKPAFMWIQTRLNWNDEFRRYVVFASSAGFSFILVYSNPVRPAAVFADIPVLQSLNPIAALTLTAVVVALGSNGIHTFIKIVDALMEWLKTPEPESAG